MAIGTVMCPLPVRESVRDLLGDLFDRQVVVERAAEPLSLTPDAALMVASFVFAGGRVAAAAVCDLPFAAVTGAALGMMPPTTDRGGDPELSDELVETFHEVLNVFSKLLNSSTTPHVRLGSLYRLPGDLPGELSAVVRYPQVQQHYDVVVDGYGGGRMAVLGW